MLLCRGEEAGAVDRVIDNVTKKRAAGKDLRGRKPDAAKAAGEGPRGRESDAAEFSDVYFYEANANHCARSESSATAIGRAACIPVGSLLGVTSEREYLGKQAARPFGDPTDDDARRTRRTGSIGDRGFNRDLNLTSTGRLAQAFESSDSPLLIHG